MKQIIPLIAAVALIACDEASAEETPNPSSPAAYLASVEGSRLQVRHTTWTGSDGTIYVTPDSYLWDSELQVACRFQKDKDGVWRCMPHPNKSGAASGHAVNGPFADTECTQLLVTWGGCGALETHLALVSNRSGQPGACGTIGWSETWSVGSEHQGPVFRRVDSGECVEGSPVAGASYWVAVEDITSTLVSGEEGFVQP